VATCFGHIAKKNLSTNKFLEEVKEIIQLTSKFKTVCSQKHAQLFIHVK